MSNNRKLGIMSLFKKKQKEIKLDFAQHGKDIRNYIQLSAEMGDIHTLIGSEEKFKELRKRHPEKEWDGGFAMLHETIKSVIDSNYKEDYSVFNPKPKTKK